MITGHLGAGSEKPADVKGKARLYSMKFCPFSHRIRLILTLKKIPHDIVNINLSNKPEWFQFSPECQVPVFKDANGMVLVNQSTIAEYLDAMYPKPPLYNVDTKSRDKELIVQYNKIVDIFSDCVHGKDNRSLDEIVAQIAELLVEYEEELKTRQTTYFGGNQPGMLDIMMWPWVERGGCLPIIYKQPLSFSIREHFPHLMKWIEQMRRQGFVLANACPYDEYVQFIEDFKAGNVDYDKI